MLSRIPFADRMTAGRPASFTPMNSVASGAQAENPYQAGPGKATLSSLSAESRVICNLHWWSDMVEGQRMGAAAGGGRLADLEVIWRQKPKVSGRGYYGHRLAFGPEGYLWISSGDRQAMQPAQTIRSNLGKIVRLLRLDPLP